MQHGIGEKKKQPQNLNSAGTLLTFRRFEGDLGEPKSQQVLRHNPLPPQLHLPMLPLSPYWYKQSFLLVHAIPSDFAGFGLLTQEKIE